MADSENTSSGFRIKPKAEVSMKSLGVSVTPKQNVILKTLAKNAEVSISELVRQMIQFACDKHEASEAEND